MTRQVYRARLVAGLIALASIVAGCGGSSAPDGAPDLTDVPSPQRAILADGEVTEAEYERAVFATLQCLREHGVIYTEPVWVDQGNRRILDFTMEFREGIPLDAYDKCHQEFQRDVDERYALQHAPSEEERRQRQAAAVECLVSRGHPITQLADLQTYLATAGEAARRDAVSCQTLAYGGFDPFATAPVPTIDPADEEPPAAFVELVPDLAADWALAGPAQRAALADGELTRAEYEASADAGIACLREIGFARVRGPEPDPTGKFLSYGAAFSSTELANLTLRPGETPQQARNRCYGEHSEAIRRVYEALHSPTPEELIEAEAAVRACIANLVTGEPGTAEFVAALNALPEADFLKVYACPVDYAREHGVLWIMPSYSGPTPAPGP